MQQTVQQITEKLIDRLPDNEQYYRLDELRNWSFPSFIVQRIKVELERNLAESMNIPKTDWANTQSEAVQQAWQHFVQAIHDEARLPASYAKTVIETAVADVIEMLVQPRKNIPNIIFGARDELSLEEVSDSVRSVVVYRHFATLIPRYMQKKELDILTKEHCKEIVKKVDEKLVSQYSPLNWAQMLEPLFNLLEAEIDTNLLRLFFEDKDRPRLSRQFDLMNDVLTRAELIEVLSSPDSLDFEGYEDDQSNLFDDQPRSQKERGKETQFINGRQPNNEMASIAQSKEKVPSEEEEVKEPEAGRQNQTEKDSDEEVNFNTGFGTEEDFGEPETEPEEPSEEPEEDSLNARFTESDREEQYDTEVTEDKQITDTKDVIETEPSEKPEANGVKSEAGVESADADEQLEELKEGSEEDEDKKETPMWMRYMSEEDIAEYEQHDAEEEYDEEGFLDDPIIDLTSEQAEEQDIENLQDQLSGDRELFVEEIFRGSERAFDEAIQQIAAYDNWREVSKFIEKDIFKRNLVDMYSESAVDFTDQLQNYFLDKQNRNK